MFWRTNLGPLVWAEEAVVTAQDWGHDQVEDAGRAAQAERVVQIVFHLRPVYDHTHQHTYTWGVGEYRQFKSRPNVQWYVVVLFNCCAKFLKRD